MRRMAYVVLAGLFLVSVAGARAAAQNKATDQPQASAQANSQSLGDYARSVRKDKKPATVRQFDNDNIPSAETVSVVGPADKPADNATTPAPAKKDENATSKDDQAKTNDQWKDKLAAQKDKIDLLSRELTVLQGEYRLRAAAMYGDAGSRLRNEGTWDKEDADYKQKIADKQKSLDDAKKELDDLQEQARKSGVPTSVREGDQK